MSVIIKRCGVCHRGFTRDEWNALRATADWVFEPDDGLPLGEILEGRQCSSAGCQATLWRDATSERLQQNKESA
jgi:hypothetical protein